MHDTNMFCTLHTLCTQLTINIAENFNKTALALNIIVKLKTNQSLALYALLFVGLITDIATSLFLSYILEQNSY